MNLYELIDEWPNIKLQKKQQALKQILNYIEDNEEDENHDSLMFDLIQKAADYEAEDYFGTEGLRV